MKSKKILITGGAGFLGSVLVPKLLKKKEYDLRIYDKLIFGNNIEEPVTLIKEDINNIEAIGKAIQEVDTVIHLAAVVGDPACVQNIGKAFETNVLATKKIAELCALWGIKKFIFTSSCSVYGAQPKKILKETSEPYPIDFYGQTKVAGENEILKSIPNATILRLGTLFGYSPRMRFDLVVNSFVAKAIRKQPLTVYGGTQHRPLLHLLDASDAIQLALEKDLKGIFNITSGNVSILELANVIKHFIPVKITITHEIVDKRDYMVSDKKIRKEGFKPKRMIEDGVIEIIEAFRSGKIDDPTKPIYYNHKWEW